MSIQNTDPVLNILGEGYDELFFTQSVDEMKRTLDTTGILVMEDFLSLGAIKSLQEEAAQLKPKAYRSSSAYNLYVLPQDPLLPEDSPRNRQFLTTKGCIPDDQVPATSYLRTLYNSEIFRKFLCSILGIKSLYPYADALSCININYYDPSDSLEWHFDNSDFAITLLVKKCEKGGEYEYFTNMRYSADGKENYELIGEILDKKALPEKKSLDEGGLMIFRGNRSLHRVTPIEAGERILVTFNFNEKPGVSLSEKSRQTFFGRIE